MACSPATSTNEIFIDEMMEDCLTDWINQTETDLDGKAPTDHAHSGYAEANHTHDGFATADHVHTGYADASHSHSEYASAEHIHTGYAAENHVHSEYAETGHTHSGFASETHNHNAEYIAKALQMVADDGNIKAIITTDVVEYMLAAPVGMRTFYSASGVTNNPKSVEAWRFMVHKTDNGASGWVMAYGSEGSVYEGYVNNGTWKGWHCLYDYSPVPLWTGEMYMTEAHVVTPSKTLSNCRNGWLLLWSDYNPGEGSNNSDFVTTFIPKRAYTGQSWNGGQFLCAIPRFAESGGEAIVVKSVNVFDAKLTGVAHNDEDSRNDVVLRAVYEI